MTLKRIKQMVKGYRGAGVLFAAPDSRGCVQVLLGQRSFSPYTGYWSIPGGAMEWVDRGDFRNCAAREAFEETVGIPMLKPTTTLLRGRLERASEYRVHVPLAFDFRTYLLPMAVMPDHRFWPNREHWGNEFRRFGWFAPDALPQPLHPFLAGAIRKVLATGTVVERTWGWPDGTVSKRERANGLRREE